MWRHMDVQADWRRSWTYGRAPNAIDISQGSLTCPSKHRHGTNLFIRWFRHTAPFSRLLRSRWGYGGHILDLTPRALTGDQWFQTRINHMILGTNAMKITQSPLCSFCRETDETSEHLFWECDHVQSLLQSIDNYCMNILASSFNVQKQDFNLGDVKGSNEDNLIRIQVKYNAMFEQKIVCWRSHSFY